MTLLVGLALPACESADEGSPPDPGGGAAIVARVDGAVIRAAELDGPLRIALHDLDRGRDRTRRDRLEFLIAARLGPEVEPGSAEWDARVEIVMAVPEAPRFEFSSEGVPTRGAATAPVTIVQFLDFASAHSRRLQPALVRLLDAFPDRLRVAVHDLPLPYHRWARGAAEAAHCAAEQGAYWAYHDVLLLEQPDLSEGDLRDYAARVGLDGRAFDACVASGRAAGPVDAGLELAATLGVHRAATVFVNGLYLSGRPDYPELERVVRAELMRLGLDATPGPLPEPSRPSEAAPPPTVDVQDPAFPEVPPELLANPEAVITLSRSEVDRALQDRRRLDGQLEASRANFVGQRLLKIRKIVEGDLYSRLGLEEGDVLMVLNGRFLTVEYNSFFETFESEPVIRMLVMRHGRPHTYEVRIR